MKLVGKVPVEPLDEERLTNIERKLVVQVSEMAQRPVHAPRRMLGFAAAALAVVVAAFVGWKLRGESAVIASEPEQLVMKDGALHLGDADIVGKDFSVVRTPGRVVVEMRKAGKLELRVDHKPGRLFVVKAGGVDVEDVGTRFSVDWDGGKLVDVRVTEGEVKVKRGGKHDSITAGNAWAIDVGPVTITALDEARAAQASGASVVAMATNQNDQTTDPSANTNSNSNASSNGNGSSNSTSNTSAISNSSGSGGSGSGKPRRAGGPNARKSLEGSGLEPLVRPDTADPKEAIVIYTKRAAELAEGEEKAGLFQSIAVMHIQMKNWSGAARAVEGVLRARESGKATGWEAYKRALWLDVKIQCLNNKDFDDECRVAAEKYLVKFPNGYEAGIVQQVLDEM
jgi:hypothetical protein